MKILITFVSALLMLCLMPLALPMCSGETPSADWSLLTGEPCGPPCWQGLTPGQSTSDEVAAFLATSGYVEDSSLRQDRSGCGEITSWNSSIGHLRDRPMSGWTSNYLCASNGTVRVLMIHLVYDLTLEQLLDRHGAPEALWAHFAGVPERRYAEVNLYYPELGLMCQLELPVQELELHPDAKVVRAWYFEPTAVSELDSLDAAMPVPDLPEFWQTWQGYGSIDLKP
ncbi:MAG: hypothetical protein GTN93_06410 [Anaerolineae bacterium]|nr:hypothetical protein [Anaerolineae bacterium]NIQ77712.1 hypothetical protein [Anaerolineae bacterium]